LIVLLRDLFRTAHDEVYREPRPRVSPHRHCDVSRFALKGHDHQDIDIRLGARLAVRVGPEQDHALGRELASDPIDQLQDVRFLYHVLHSS
jgi:hypothetical protein